MLTRPSDQLRPVEFPARFLDSLQIVTFIEMFYYTTFISELKVWLRGLLLLINETFPSQYWQVPR